ncbi:hypothetical protein EV360DRAFT_71318, partial [Lentinula raphanica]
STIALGHLKTRWQIHLPIKRVQDSFRRVDALGVLLRWGRLMKRRVYKVRGANALWHQDGNEKLRPWGFWVHGCNAVGTFGWPSRVRGDFGKENNGIEVVMVRHWGEEHRAYIRGSTIIRSSHNVRIERLWRDVRKDSLESFRKIFKYLEDNGLLDMTNNIQRLCLYVVFQPRIQQSLNRTADAWNQHRISTAGHKTPIALYELSREHAKTRGYWTGDPGDDIRTARDPLYGLEAELDGGMPGDHQVPEEDSADIRVNDEDAILYTRSAFKDMEFDVEQEDGNWGIENYCQAVLKFKAFVESQLP